MSSNTCTGAPRRAPPLVLPYSNTSHSNTRAQGLFLLFLSHAQRHGRGHLPPGELHLSFEELRPGGEQRARDGDDAAGPPGASEKMDSRFARAGFAAAPPHGCFFPGRRCLACVGHAALMLWKTPVVEASGRGSRGAPREMIRASTPADDTRVIRVSVSIRIRIRRRAPPRTPRSPPWPGAPPAARGSPRGRTSAWSPTWPPAPRAPRSCCAATPTEKQGRSRGSLGRTG